MRKCITIILILWYSTNLISQESYFSSGWIRSEIGSKAKTSQKDKNSNFRSKEKGPKENVWIESSDGWITLNYSLQSGSDTNIENVFQESIPIYDNNLLLWKKGEIHRLEGPFYAFEFKIFDISGTQGKNSEYFVSLYYRWVIRDREEDT